MQLASSAAPFVPGRGLQALPQAAVQAWDGAVDLHTQQQQQQQQQLQAYHALQAQLQQQQQAAAAGLPPCLPSLSKSPMIRDVWADNLDAEFAVIRSLVKDYPIVSMDTEFPGVVAKPVGSFKTTHEFYYQTLRCNVNLLKIIQLGITLLNERGEVPEEVCTWQFNFRFNIHEDVYAQDSIELLTHGGINFDYFTAYGIEVTHFAEQLISSGLLLTPDVRWLAFHAGYDFGYLAKVVCNKELPEKEEDFLQLFHALFPCVFDVKYLLRATEHSHSFGLDYLAETLKLRRFGTAHQAGSDSLLTGHAYFKLLRDSFGGTPPLASNGVLYGLSEDAASSATPNSAPSISASTLSASASAAAAAAAAGGSGAYSSNNNSGGGYGSPSLAYSGGGGGAAAAAFPSTPLPSSSSGNSSSARNNNNSSA